MLTGELGLNPSVLVGSIAVQYVFSFSVVRETPGLQPCGCLWRKAR